MEIELLYVPECPHRALARVHVERALARTGLSARVQEQEVRTSEEAARFGMRGSPTILIDGRDPFEAMAGSTALACRLYRGDTELAGAPTVGQLIEVLAAYGSEGGPSPKGAS